jgi:hypothetical protein
VRPATDLAAFIAGFVAGEGTFTGSGNDRFRFAVELGASDRSSCDLLRAYFEVGHVNWYRRRKEHYDDEVVFAVQSLRELVEVIVPFMDEHLAPSYKRQQYEQWRGRLLDYWEHRAKRRRSCTIDGCDRPHRARGYCRRHYFLAFGS